MTIKAPGTSLSLSEINLEYALGRSFGVHRGVYRFNPSTNTLSTFASTGLKMSDFYNQSRRLLVTLQTPVNNFNLRNYMLSKGWNGTTALSANVDVQTNISSSSTATPAFATGSLSGGQVKLTVASGYFIVGKGGDGGEGRGSGTCGANPGSPGNAGGTALSLTSPTQLINNGTIGGGGGGGGGGGAEISYIWQASAGGGGGGAGYGTGGPGGTCGVNGGRFGGAGGNGGISTGGVGGNRGNEYLAMGGAGGNLGYSGSVGQNSRQVSIYDGTVGGDGGAPGRAVQNMQNILSGSTTGTIIGGYGILQTGTTYKTQQINYLWPSYTPYNNSITNNITLTPDDSSHTTWTTPAGSGGITISASGTTTRSVTFSSSSVITSGTETKSGNFTFTATNGTTTSSITVYVSHLYYAGSQDPAPPPPAGDGA